MILTIAAIAALLVVAVSYSVYRSRTKDIVRLSIIPICLVLSVLLGQHYLNELGKPIEGFPTDKFVYVHHVAGNENITLWVTHNGKSKLYIFPFSDDAQKKLKKANDQTQQGQRVEGKPTKRRMQGNDEAPGEFKYELKPIERDLTK